MEQKRSEAGSGLSPARRTDRSDRIRSELRQYGIALIRGVEDAGQLVELTRQLGNAVPHPDADVHGVTTIAVREAPREGTLGAGFTRAALAPHTDRADLPVPPPLLATVCTTPARTGGACTVADGAAVLRLLAAREPDALRALLEPGAVSYGRTYVYTGPVAELLGDGRLRLRVWPSAAGRFTPAAARALGPLREAVAARTRSFHLRAGDGYVIDNHRWLHGRQAFTGARVMLRVGIDPHPGRRISTGIPGGWNEGGLGR